MSGEKTEKPTPKKIKDARKKGQVAQSQDVGKLLILVAIIETMVATSNLGMEKLKLMVHYAVTLSNQPFAYALQAIAVNALSVIAFFSLIAAGIAVTLKLASSWLQFGFLFAAEALKPDFNRINPVSQAKQMFSGKKLSELGNNILKAVFISVTFYLLITPMLGLFIQLAYGDLNAFWLQSVAMFAKIERTCAASLLVLATFDFALQKYFHLKELRMEKHEVKREHKDQEGDPLIKSMRRQMGHELVESGGTPPPINRDNTDAVVVNPTHYAVALYYRSSETPLPRIVSKGQDQQAQWLIQQAQQQGIAVIRYVWLARTLYTRPIGQYIPRQTLMIVAQLYQLLRALEGQLPAGVTEFADLEAQLNRPPQGQ